MAGLAAAGELVSAGYSVRILEARDRPGGRLQTITAGRGLPIELGAELIHGDKNPTWDLIRAAKLRTNKVPDRHWSLSDRGLKEMRDFWDRLGEVTERINTLTPAQELQSV